MDRIVYVYSYVTRIGIITLTPCGNHGAYCVVWDDGRLGTFDDARQAAWNASKGRIASPSPRIDMGSLDLPEDLDRWERRLFIGRIQQRQRQD